MGLESVEIVLDIETAFGIGIPDREVQKIITVGDLHNIVWSCVKDRKNVYCKSQNLFYKLRSAFSDVTQFPKEKITLQTNLSEVVPVANRRKIWNELSNTLALKFPGLILPKLYSYVLATIAIIFISATICTALLLINQFGFSTLALLIPVLGFFILLYFSTLVQAKKNVIEQIDFKQLTNKVIQLNFKVDSVIGEVGRHEMELTINKIISEKAGLEIEEVTPEKRICYDLGID